MTTFGPLNVTPDRGKFILIDDFRAVDPVRDEIIVKAGYRTDIYSAPWGFGWLAKGLRPEPAILHDWVNARGVTEITRQQKRWSTGIFNRAMKACGIPLWKRWLMLLFVSIFTFPDHYL